MLLINQFNYYLIRYTSISSIYIWIYRELCGYNKFRNKMKN